MKGSLTAVAQAADTAMFIERGWIPALRPLNIAYRPTKSMCSCTLRVGSVVSPPIPFFLFHSQCGRRIDNALFTRHTISLNRFRLIYTAFLNAENFDERKIGRRIPFLGFIIVRDDFRVDRFCPFSDLFRIFLRNWNCEKVEFLDWLSGSR